MSKARKGEKHPLYGKPVSLETRRRISEARKGKPISVETWRKMVERRRLSFRIKNHKKI